MSNNVLKAAVVTGVIALGAAGVAQANSSPVPGKPGPLNIVQTALAANAPGSPTAGAFDTLLAAATCDYFDEAVVNLLSGSDRYTLFARPRSHGTGYWMS